MEKVYELLFELIGDILKIVLVTVVIIGVLTYTSLYIVGYKTIREAEQQGYFSKANFNKYLQEINISENKIQIEEINPPWNQKVDKIGQPMYLKYKQKLSYVIFNKKVEFDLVINIEGINQGYYGTGY